MNFIEKFMNSNDMSMPQFIFSTILFLIIVGVVIFLALKRIKGVIVIPLGVTIVVLFFLSVIFNIKIAYIFSICFFIMLLCSISIIIIPELKSDNQTKTERRTKNFALDDTDKEKLINIIIRSVEHLSSRRTGAIITIEKEHTLNAYIEKAIRLDSYTSVELIETIFHPNTPLHDGAIIIRGNKIICASAFYPSSDKSDIPLDLGSRHRAAIGISEIADAFTIVVSEESGRVATTIDGTITIDVSFDALRNSLQQHIIVSKGE